MHGSKRMLVGFVLLLLPVLCHALGDQIAYLRLTGQYWQAWVTDPDGHEHHQLTFDPIDKTRITWLPDRTAILCDRSDGTLAFVAIDNPAPVPINLPVAGILDAQLSPDGHTIAYSVSVTQNLDNNDLWLINIESRKKKRLTYKPGVVLSPAWNPQGTAILYSSGAVNGEHEIWQVNLSTGNNTQQTIGTGRKIDPSVSPQGEIAYASDTTGNFNIWVLDKHANESKQLTRDDSHNVMPSWSPDGQQLAFFSMQGGQRRIWVMDRNGTTSKPITPENAASRSPAWIR